MQSTSRDIFGWEKRLCGLKRAQKKFKRALEAFQHGRRCSTDPADIKLFDQQVAEVEKVKVQMKNDLLQLITEPKFSPNDVKHDLKIRESGPNLLPPSENVSKEPRKFTRKSSAPDQSAPSFDFIHLKDIDGKVLKQPDHNVSENEPETLNRSVHFAVERESPGSAKQPPSKGILKGGLRRQVTAPLASTKTRLDSGFEGLD